MIENGTKECPYCAEIIKADAIKCMYCKTLLNGESESDKLQASAKNKTVDSAKQSVSLGIIGLLLFFLPIVTLILSGMGLANGFKGLKTIKRKLSVIGILICAIGIFVNIGFYIIVFRTAVSAFNEMEEAQRIEEEKAAQELEEGWYLDHVDRNFTLIIDTLELLDLHINNKRLVRDDEWNNRVNWCTEAIRSHAGSIIDYEAPDKYKSSHQQLREALKSLMLAMDYIDNRDFVQANKYIEESRVLLETSRALLK